MWWRELHKERVMRGEEPCRTWNGIKAVLRRRIAPPLESKKKVATVGAQNAQGTQANMRSSWADSIAGDEYVPTFDRPAVDINSYKKMLGFGVSYGKSMHFDSFSSQSYEKKGVSPSNSAMKRAAALKDEVQTGKMKTASSVRFSSVNQFESKWPVPLLMQSKWLVHFLKFVIL
jgi:hypothetical protein